MKKEEGRLFPSGAGSHVVLKIGECIPATPREQNSAEASPGCAVCGQENPGQK